MISHFALKQIKQLLLLLTIIHIVFGTKFEMCLHPLQDEVEASVGCGLGAPGRGQQDVPAFALPVPSGPAHSGPIPVPELSAALPAGSAPAASPHPQPRSWPAAPLTAESNRSQNHAGKYLKDLKQPLARRWRFLMRKDPFIWMEGRSSCLWFLIGQNVPRKLNGSSGSLELLSFTSDWPADF